MEGAKGWKNPRPRTLFALHTLHTSFALRSSLLTLRRLAATFLIFICLLILSRRSFAHPLDEYVQATYLTLGVDSIGIDLALNPGVFVAEELLAVIDLDQDGEVSEREARAYGEDVLREVRLVLDGESILPVLGSVEFPSLDALRRGEGIIKLSVRVAAHGDAGDHVLTYFNSHKPVTSVYLANAYLPDPPISITDQTRDWYQQGIRISYTVERQGLTPYWAALGAGVACIALALVWRGRRSRRSPPTSA